LKAIFFLFHQQAASSSNLSNNISNEECGTQQTNTHAQITHNNRVAPIVYRNKGVAPLEATLFCSSSKQHLI